MSCDILINPRIKIVVPVTFRQLSHEGVAGHMGVRKTYDRILRKFYWPQARCNWLYMVLSYVSNDWEAKPENSLGSVTAYCCCYNSF